MRKRGSGTGKRGGKGETNKYQQNMETGEIERCRQKWRQKDRVRARQKQVRGRGRGRKEERPKHAETETETERKSETDKEAETCRSKKQTSIEQESNTM